MKERFLWWANFLLWGWAAYLLLCAGFGVAYYVERRKIMRALNDSPAASSALAQGATTVSPARQEARPDETEQAASLKTHPLAG